jgi:Nucleotidyl transferase AbiEii toxin, Type IV TA system
MPKPADHLQVVGEIVQDLRALGLEPVLVGGMALVVLGSRRVTRDFDFVIPHPGDRLESTVDLFYDLGLELASRLNEVGDVVSTITNREVAAIRLRLDAPSSAYFFNTETGLRVDLLFDFPIPAEKLAQHAIRTRIRSHAFAIASEEDLLRLKKIAIAARSAPGDAEDINFLESRRKGSRSVAQGTRRSRHR